MRHFYRCKNDVYSWYVTLYHLVFYSSIDVRSDNPGNFSPKYGNRRSTWGWPISISWFINKMQGCFKLNLLMNVWSQNGQSLNLCAFSAACHWFYRCCWQTPVESSARTSSPATTCSRTPTRWENVSSFLWCYHFIETRTCQPVLCPCRNPMLRAWLDSHVQVPQFKMTAFPATGDRFVFC